MIDAKQVLVIDTAFIEAFPIPHPAWLKERFVSEALVTVQATLDNEVSLPIGVEYVAKVGKTGPNMENKFKQQSTKVQTCLECLTSASEVNEHILGETECNSYCQVCK